MKTKISLVLTSSQKYRLDLLCKLHKCSARDAVGALIEGAFERVRDQMVERQRELDAQAKAKEIIIAS